jgi:transcriptional regulator with XRE-family HTH domain
MKYELTDVTNQLKAAREARGLGQRELGRLAGVPQSHISRIESGNVDLRVSSLIGIARALGMELTLVPRGTLPIIRSIAQGSVRSPTPSPKLQPAVQRELKRIESTLASLVRENPANEQLAQFQRQARELRRLRVPDSYLQTIREAEKNLRAIQRQTENLGSIGTILSEFQQLRNTLVHGIAETPASDITRPAYSLDDDNG